jgi:hypothetical protein
MFFSGVDAWDSWDVQEEDNPSQNEVVDRTLSKGIPSITNSLHKQPDPPENPSREQSNEKQQTRPLVQDVDILALDVKMSASSLAFGEVAIMRWTFLRT